MEERGELFALDTEIQQESPRRFNRRGLEMKEVSSRSWE